MTSEKNKREDDLKKKGKGKKDNLKKRMKTTSKKIKKMKMI